MFRGEQLNPAPPLVPAVLAISTLLKINQENLWLSLCSVDKVALYTYHTLERILESFVITGGTLAFDRESLQSCLLTVPALPSSKK